MQPNSGPPCSIQGTARAAPQLRLGVEVLDSAFTLWRCPHVLSDGGYFLIYPGSVDTGLSRVPGREADPASLAQERGRAMLTPDTFLLTLYVTVDDFCKVHRAPRYHPGPRSGLCESEVVTLCIYGQWRQFRSERAFYRYAARREDR